MVKVVVNVSTTWPELSTILTVTGWPVSASDVVPAIVNPALAALALAAALSLTLSAHAQIEFQPAGGGFRVAFPAQPRVTREQVSTRFGNTIGVMARYDRADGAQFFAQYTDYPSAAANEGPQRLFDGLKLGRTVKGELRFEERFQFDGNPAQREIVDWHAGTRPVIVSLDVLRGLRLYSVFCIVDRGVEVSPAVRDFIQSFALLPL